ncbi:hypothetical protein LB941_06455 [Ligilactobacillus sp. WILCCON 0076]|uniref:Uncharacterized protein n=1 Tax=Ligilactobacillus ubinensis TaxID=2876789 RepID=A0A9X2FKP1_9LACO|nr:hypothetical protein [Ligilactobacillus ubinensis]MCP0886974.1 hypothetical protein [Ligilactobacillus ubinensis]
MNKNDMMIHIIDPDYSDLNFEYSPITTTSDNPYLKSGDIVCIALLKKNKLNYIKDKDIVAFKSTDKHFLLHLYKVEELSLVEYQFHPLSSFLDKKPFILEKNKIEESGLEGKVLYSINRLNNFDIIALLKSEEENSGKK